MMRVPVAPEGVELGAHLAGDLAEVAGVEPHGAERRPGDLDREPDRLGDVVGVDEQGRADAQRVDLGAEGVGLGVVQQGEGVRGGARGRHAVALAGGQVGGGREAGDVRRPRRRDGGLLVGAPRAHLDAGAVPGGQRHPGRGRGDRRVVVVDRQQQGLQQHRLGEGALDDQERRVGEVGLALGVAPDVAGEAVGREPVERSSSTTSVERGEGGVVEDGSASIASRARPTPATTP